jgi:glycosyltransferase involved in cell wall biosynthesis
MLNVYQQGKTESCRSLRVVIISKALIVGAYHKKLDELALLGVELSLIVPTVWGGLTPEKHEGNGYRIYPLDIFFPGHNHVHFYRGIGALINAIKPDIVHIDEEHYSFVTYQIMRLAKKARARSLFFTWQNIYKKYPFPFSYFEKYNFNNASVAIAGNREAAEILRKKGFEKEIFEIPQFGVDPDLFRKMDGVVTREHLDIKNDDFIIGYMGRLVEEKGIDTLLDALIDLPVNAKLLLIGSGPYKDKILDRANHPGIKNRVILIDQVPSLEVPRYMNCMDCLVLPSLTKSNWKEQFGRVLIEAMACEISVIGSSSGEIPMVIGDAGLIFQEGNAHDLLKQLDLLIRDREFRKKLGERGRQRVLDHYTQKKIAQATYIVYKRMLPG